MDEEMRQPEEMVSVIDGKKVQEILEMCIRDSCKADRQSDTCRIC